MTNRDDMWDNDGTGPSGDGEGDGLPTDMILGDGTRVWG